MLYFLPAAPSTLNHCLWLLHLCVGLQHLPGVRQLLSQHLFHCLWQLHFVLDNSTFLESDSCSPKHPVPLSLTVILVWSEFWLLPTPYSIVSNTVTVIVYLCVLDFGYTNTLFHCLWQLHLCDLDFGYSQHHIPVSLTVTLVCFGIQLLPTPYSIISDSYTCVFWIAAPPWGHTATLPVPSLWHQMAPICGCTKLWLMPDCCSQSPRVPGQMMWAVHTL